MRTVLSRTVLSRTVLCVVLLVVSVVGAAVAVAQVTTVARTSDGAICGSVWHWRPGHGAASGGLRTPTELAASTRACQAAVARPFSAGAAAGGLASVALLGAVVLTFAEVKGGRLLR